MKKFLIATLAATTMLCNTADAKPVNDRETIYQVALLQSLALGHFDGSITVKDLKTFGDTGIGTFEGLDGEMIFIDGVVYRANQDCKINVVADKVTIPFSNVTFFDKDFSVDLMNIADKTRLEAELNKLVAKNGVNDFYMIKLHGNFNAITVRSERGQVKPYPTLVESLQATQKECTFENISGTIVGLYCPEFMSSLNSVGWHFHFISDDKKFGGHVLELNLNRGTAQFDKTAAFRMGLPNNADFDALNFKTDLKEDIRKAEQDSYQGDK